MAIKFFESYDNHVGSYTIGIPESILAKIQAAIEGIDRVLPGIQKVMEVSELGIVYDEKKPAWDFPPHPARAPRKLFLALAHDVPGQQRHQEQHRPRDRPHA